MTTLYDELKARGWIHAQTGGGCTALEYIYSDQSYAMITEEEDAHAPETWDVGCTLGFYDSEGEPLVCFGVASTRQAVEIAMLRNDVMYPHMPQPPQPLVVGQRVRFTHDLDRFPHFYVPKGLLGTVTEADEYVHVKVDVILEGAEEWDNEVIWVLGDGDKPERDVEVITDVAPVEG